jgi:surface protein
MFSYCYALKNLNLRNFDTSNVTDMQSMFCECKSLTSLDLSSFHTGKVTLMSRMFYNCINLETANLVSFNTSNVLYTHYMFYNCEKLKEINMSLYLDKCKSIEYMFFNCNCIREIDLSHTILKSDVKAEQFISQIDSSTNDPVKVYLVKGSSTDTVITGGTGAVYWTVVSYIYV